jgi:hypothetical protein
LWNSRSRNFLTWWNRNEFRFRIRIWIRIQHKIEYNSPKNPK